MFVVESPLSSQVFGFMPDRISPPPAPIIAKHQSGHISPIETRTPMFFPSCQTLLLSEHARGGSNGSFSSSYSPSDKEVEMRRKQLERRLASCRRSRPMDVTSRAARLRLRPKYHHLSSHGNVASIPELPCSSGSREAEVSVIKPVATVKQSDPYPYQAKLPPFQRGVMRRDVVRKLNRRSYVARPA